MQPASPPSSGLERWWPRASLRRYLVAVILLATLPLATLMCWQILTEVRAEQAQVESDLLALGRRAGAGGGERAPRVLRRAGALAHPDPQQGALPQALLKLLPAAAAAARLAQRVPAGRETAICCSTRATPAPAGPAAGEDWRQLHERVLRQRHSAVSGLVPTRAARQARR